MENSKWGFIEFSTKMRRVQILRLFKHCEYDTIPQNGLKLTIKSHYVLEIGQPCLQQKSHFTLKQQFYWNTRFRPNGVPRLQPPIGIRRATFAASVTWSTVAARLRLVTFGVKSVGCRLSSLANLRPYYFSSKTSRHVCLTKCVNFFSSKL